MNAGSVRDPASSPKSRESRKFREFPDPSFEFAIFRRRAPFCGPIPALLYFENSLLHPKSIPIEIRDGAAQIVVLLYTKIFRYNNPVASSLSRLRPDPRFCVTLISPLGPQNRARSRPPNPRNSQVLPGCQKRKMIIFVFLIVF